MSRTKELVRNTEPVRELHAAIVEQLDSLADALTVGGGEVEQRLEVALRRLAGVLVLHAAEARVLWDMADRMIAMQRPRRYTDSLRQIHGRVDRQRVVLREEAAEGGGREPTAKRRRLALELAAVVRAEIEVEAVVVLDLIDQLPPKTFANTKEAAELARRAPASRPRREAPRGS